MSPNATMIVIEHAERFDSPSSISCGDESVAAAFAGSALIGEPTTEDGRRRLEAIGSTEDGFRIAELDRRSRDRANFGARESGLARFAWPTCLRISICFASPARMRRDGSNVIRFCSINRNRNSTSTHGDLRRFPRPGRRRLTARTARTSYDAAMSFNRDIVDAFETATLLEVTAPGSVNASAKVARVAEGASRDLRTDAEAEDGVKRLTGIEGIGASSARKIVELALTGRIEALEELRATVPEGLRVVMDVPGLGPKTVRRLWQELGVESLDDLEAALADGSRPSRMGRRPSTISSHRSSS